MHPSMHVVTTDYEGLVPKKLKIGDMIYIDDGYFGAKVTSFCNDRNYCVMEACNNGMPYMMMYNMMNSHCDETKGCEYTWFNDRSAATYNSRR